MKSISVVGSVAGFVACLCATVLCQGCDSTPGTVGGGSGGAGAGVTINLGGQTGIRTSGTGGRTWGTGGRTGSGVVADAAIVDVPGARKDAPTEGNVSDAKGAPTQGTDGPQALDQAAEPDVSAKEAVVRDTMGAIDAKTPPDVAVRDLAPVIDASAVDVSAPDDAAAAGCSYGGVTYAVGDAFPNDCNTCFCVAGGEVVCTVKPCSIDGGLAAPLSQSGRDGTVLPERGPRPAI
jgi:hypothetical protein